MLSANHNFRFMIQPLNMLRQNTKTTHSVVKALRNFPCKLPSLLSIPCNYNRNWSRRQCKHHEPDWLSKPSLDSRHYTSHHITLRVIHTIQLCFISLCPLRSGTLSITSFPCIPSVCLQSFIFSYSHSSFIFTCTCSPFLFISVLLTYLLTYLLHAAESFLRS